MDSGRGFHFFRRAFPSANMVLVRGARAALVDSGFGSDAAETERLIRRAGAAPETIGLIVNTHSHSDHAGGNRHFQANFGTQTAAHADDAAIINARDPEACCAEWLAQPVESYRVDRGLEDGEILDFGAGLRLRVLHAPGHRQNQICLHCAEEKTLILGDFLHGDDAGWINSFREGSSPLEQAGDSLERLASLKVDRAFSGHGAAIADFQEAVNGARSRYAYWKKNPEKMAWHAIKRIFAYALMLADGVDGDEIEGFLMACPWFEDYANRFFQADRKTFAEDVLGEMLRSNAAVWREGRLYPAAPYTPPSPGWLKGPGKPAEWTV